MPEKYNKTIKLQKLQKAPRILKWRGQRAINRIDQGKIVKVKYASNGVKLSSRRISDINNILTKYGTKIPLYKKEKLIQKKMQYEEDRKKLLRSVGGVYPTTQILETKLLNPYLPQDERQKLTQQLAEINKGLSNTLLPKIQQYSAVTNSRFSSRQSRARRLIKKNVRTMRGYATEQRIKNDNLGDMKTLKSLYIANNKSLNSIDEFETKIKSSLVYDKYRTPDKIKNIILQGLVSDKTGNYPALYSQNDQIKSIIVERLRLMGNYIRPGIGEFIIEKLVGETAVNRNAKMNYLRNLMYKQPVSTTTLDLLRKEEQKLTNEAKLPDSIKRKTAMNTLLQLEKLSNNNKQLLADLMIKHTEDAKTVDEFKKINELLKTNSITDGAKKIEIQQLLQKKILELFTSIKNRTSNNEITPENTHILRYIRDNDIQSNKSVAIKAIATELLKDIDKNTTSAGNGIVKLNMNLKHAPAIATATTKLSAAETVLSAVKAKQTSLENTLKTATDNVKTTQEKLQIATIKHKQQEERLIYISEIWIQAQATFENAKIALETAKQTTNINQIQGAEYNLRYATDNLFQAKKTYLYDEHLLSVAKTELAEATQNAIKATETKTTVEKEVAGVNKEVTDAEKTVQNKQKDVERAQIGLPSEEAEA